MRSPKHLAATVFVVAAILVAAGIILPRLFGGQDGGQAVSPASDHSSREGTPRAAPGETSTSMPTRLTEPLVTPSPVEPDPRALEIASKWAKAWVHHPKGTTEKEWLDGLEPYTTAEFLPVMKSVRLANIPSSKVTGEPKAVSSYAKSVVAKVPTDGPELRITVVDTAEGWRVTHYERAG